MISIITGDIIKSSKRNPELWLPGLKDALNYLQPDKNLWEVYRGDSFQLELHEVKHSFMACIYIKSCIKLIKGLDIRLAVGLGSKSFTGINVSESNGPAFRYSGETIETLKKDKLNLRIKSDFEDFDQKFNLYFKLIMIALDNWTVNSAEIVKLAIEHPDKKQHELAELLNVSQHAVSKRLKRAHMDEILELDTYFKSCINSIS